MVNDCTILSPSLHCLATYFSLEVRCISFCPLCEPFSKNLYFGWNLIIFENQCSWKLIIFLKFIFWRAFICRQRRTHNSGSLGSYTRGHEIRPPCSPSAGPLTPLFLPFFGAAKWDFNDKLLLLSFHRLWSLM